MVGNFIRNPFGEIIAEDWINSHDENRIGFVIGKSNPQAFELSAGKSSIIIGRKGSGKTTLLHMMKNNKGIVNCEIDIGREFSSVANILKINEKGEYTEPSSDLWKRVIWNNIIIHVIDMYREDITLNKVDKNKILQKYANNIFDSTEENNKNTLSRFADFVSGKVSGGLTGLGAALASASLDRTRNIEEAKNILFDYLRNNNIKVRVFIDTKESYRVGVNSVSSDCLRGLIHCASGIHREFELIECFMFFPDELTQYFKNYISHSNLKDFRDAIYLRWNTADLICMMALRLQDNVFSKFGIDENRDLNFHSVEVSQKFLQKILPPTLSTKSGVSVETLTFIMAHTQYTPRHVLIFLNSLLSKSFEITETGTLSINALSKEDKYYCSDIFNSCVSRIFDDIIATYRDIYPDAKNLISEIVPRISFVCTDDDLRKIYQNLVEAEISSIEYGKLKEMLSDIGVLGLVMNKQGSGVLGHFSFISDESIVLSASYEFCVHPIFSAIFPPISQDDEEIDAVMVHPHGAHVHFRPPEPAALAARTSWKSVSHPPGIRR
tara:strand:- start:903 stop:2558 length:1656 start_codon:yes stop_codon:yes gene_type:complete